MKQAIQNLYNLEVTLKQVADAAWDAHVQPLLGDTPTIKDVYKAMSEVGLAASDEELQVRELPADWTIRFIMELDKARQRAKGAA